MNDFVGFRIPDRIKRELTRLAKKDDRTVSYICKQFVLDGLDRLERAKARKKK